MSDYTDDWHGQEAREEAAPARQVSVTDTIEKVLGDDAPVRDETGSWIFGKEAACRFIARTSWPWEATENRDAWAPRIGAEPEFGRKELAQAHRKLDEAAEALGLLAADLERSNR